MERHNDDAGKIKPNLHRKKKLVIGVVIPFFAIWWPTYDMSKNIFQKRDFMTDLWPTISP